MDAAEMPRYRSHKTVRAMEITSRTGERIINFGAFGAREFPAEMFARYQPVAGDYLVVYADGYESFSPKKAFEEGYAPLIDAGEDDDGFVSPQMTREDILRQCALQMSKDHHGIVGPGFVQRSSADELVKDARVFFDFLKG